MGASVVPDQIKCAIVAQHAPKAIKRFLKMIPSDVVYNYTLGLGGSTQARKMTKM